MEKKHEIAWKVSSPDGSFADTVFEDWFQMCAYIMGQAKCPKNFSVEMCFIYR